MVIYGFDSLLTERKNQGVISLELLTVFFDGPLAVYICYLIAKGNPKASIWMIVLATCELYGGTCDDRTDVCI